MRKANVSINGLLAGTLVEDEDGYLFSYDSAYLQNTDAEPVSLTLPLSDKPFRNPELFPFFDGLIPEGWLLQVAERNWNLNTRDRMGLLLAYCKDCIGAISIEEAKL